MELIKILMASLSVAICGTGSSQAQMALPTKPVSSHYTPKAFVAPTQANVDVFWTDAFAAQTIEGPCDAHDWNNADDSADDSEVTASFLVDDKSEPALNIGGWFSFGYTSQSTDLFNSEPDSFNLNQGWLYIEKPAKAREDNRIGWGFRFDGVYGVNANDTQAFGNTVDAAGDPRGWDNGFQNGIYGWALPQVYLEFAKNDWSVKLGHFFTIIGYEVVTAPENFFYSHSITSYESEPFTHTGALATWKVNKSTTVYGGWTAGWDTGFDQFENGSNFLGGFTRKFNADFTFTYTTAIGDFGDRGTNGYLQSLLFQLQHTENLSSLLQCDYLRVDSTGEDNFGLVQYLFYDVNEKVKLGTRMEWWKGDSITGYAPHGGILPPTGSHSYYEVTTGLNYRFSSNLVCRPEYRYDWSPAVQYDQGIFAIDFVCTY